MKTLNLKGMSWFMALAMICLVSLASCSDEDEGGALAPVFPELKEVNIPAGGSDEITFDANLDWTLTSDAGWCKFVNGEFEESTLSGKAGAQTVQVVVSADGQGYEEDAIAQITLEMAEQSQVIYKVIRAKKEYQNLVVTDAEGNVYEHLDAAHPLILKGNLATGEVTTSVKAIAEEGIEVGITAPEWITVQPNDETGMYDLTFNLENEAGYNFKYAVPDDADNVITFMTEDAATVETDKLRKVSIYVKYEGMDENSLGLSASWPALQARPDGKLVTDSGEADELSTEVICRNDEYEIVEFVQKGEAEFDFSADGDLDWIESSKDGATVTFNALENNSGAERNAVIMAFPKAVYEQIKNDLEGGIIETIVAGEGDETVTTTGIASKYTTFVIANLTQEAKTAQAETIEFIAYGIAMKSYMGSGWDVQPFSSMGVEGDVVKIEKLSAGSVSGIDCDNMYRMTFVNSDLSSMIQDYGDDSTYFVVCVEGMGSDQTLGEYVPVAGVRSVNVNFSDYVMDETNPDGWSQVNRIALGMVLSNPASAPDYAIAVRNADGTVAAYCEIVFSAE